MNDPFAWQDEVEEPAASYPDPVYDRCCWPISSTTSSATPGVPTAPFVNFYG